jgi:hypothetical protein
VQTLNYTYFEKLDTDDLSRVRCQIDAVIDDRARQFDLFASPPELPAAGLPAPAPASLNPVGPLSPSQLNCWLDCNARWMYRYLLEMPDTVSAARALGSAVHAAIAENFRQKIETREDLDSPGVVAMFLTELDRELDGAALSQDDDLEDLRDTGRAAVATYLDQVAPAIDPAAVELPVSGSIGGVAVRGYIDILDTSGRVIDIKTAKKRPSGIRADHRLQVTAYKLLEPRARAARIDTLVKSRTIAIVEQSFEVTPADERAAVVLYPLAHEAMQAGLYAPNRNSMLCSRKHCPYWERCMDDFGGEVR